MNDASKPSVAGTPSRSTLVYFLLLALLWGSSFLFMKLALQGVSAPQLALGRAVLGAATLTGIMLVSRRRWPREPRIWGHMLVIAVTLCAIPFTLFAWAEQYVPSGLASIYNATTPIMTLIAVPLMLPGERLARAQIVGLLTGIAGVIVLVAPWTLIGDSSLAGSVPAQLALLGATACYGFSLSYLRRFLSGTRYDAPTLSAVQVVLAAGILLIVAPFDALDRGAISGIALSWSVVLSLLALGCLGTGVAYIWNTRIVRDWGAPRASTVTYLTPLVGVVLGMALLGERLHWNEPVGGLLVIAGILAAQGGFSARSRRIAAPQSGSRVASTR